MLKNIHLKIFALLLAVLFWLFIVSLENTFYKFPEEIQIQVFNQSQDLGLATKLGSVHLTIRAQDNVAVRTISANDFEAYVDLRDVGAGTRKVPVSVTSKNSSISVLRVDPSEVEVKLEPMREKLVLLKTEVAGQPAKGYSISTIKLSQDNISVEGAESVLKKISQVKALITFDGTEKGNVTKTVTATAYDQSGLPIDGIKIKPDTKISANIEIKESEITKQVGIKPVLTGKITNGVINKIEVEPATIDIKGSRATLDGISTIETEQIDLSDVQASFEKKVHLQLPTGATLANNTLTEVTVRVEIEKQ